MKEISISYTSLKLKFLLCKKHYQKKISAKHIPDKGLCRSKMCKKKKKKLKLNNKTTKTSIKNGPKTLTDSHQRRYIISMQKNVVALGV